MKDAPNSDCLDLRGLKCPLPAMLTRKALERLAPGTALTVLTSDPMAVVDIPHMCYREGHTLLGMTPRGDHHEFQLSAGVAEEAEAPNPQAGA